MTPADIIALALSLGGTQTEARLVAAFAVVESSCRDLPARWDVRQHSAGLYQFGKARWRECGGAPNAWGKAPPAEQTRIMLLAIRRYSRQARKRSIKAPSSSIISPSWLTAIGRCHNRGSIGSNAATPYTRKLIDAYRRTAEKRTARPSGATKQAKRSYSRETAPRSTARP